MADLKLALYHYRDAGRKRELYGDDLLPKARESLEVTERSFAGGSSDFTDVVDAERTVLEMELSYERARADEAIGLAEIERLTGRDTSLTAEGR